MRARIVTGIFFMSLAVAARAASVPAWLDESITKWNSVNPADQIRFVNIKDSFAWYDMAKGGSVDQKEIRDRVNTIVLKNGYQPLDDEELVTTGKPPVSSGRAMQKKCWSRSFVLNIQAQNNTIAVGDEHSGQRQRMLTSLVCEDTNAWWAAFRVAN
ncbi:MAG TPA: hypothetical protein VFV19_07225 [Candidatus Polarisedimenticolaceae bacterium]|nr:hypothetical protein [Candidatus Polarisedimenticolaceae bacterium]